MHPAVHLALGTAMQMPARGVKLSYCLLLQMELPAAPCGATNGAQSTGILCRPAVSGRLPKLSGAQVSDAAQSSAMGRHCMQTIAMLSCHSCPPLHEEDRPCMEPVLPANATRF